MHQLYFFTILLWILSEVDETDRETDRQTDRQAGRQAGREAGRQTDRDKFLFVYRPVARYKGDQYY